MSDQKFLYCAIDTETTGLDRFKDEVVQVTIIPLIFDKEQESEFFRVDENRPIFNQYIIPTVPINPGASKITGMTLDVLKERGAISPEKSVGVFKDWFNTLGVKTILPMGHNWADFDKMFVIHWLESGGANFSDYFGYANRDTLILAHFLNDVHFLLGMKSFNPKLHAIAKDKRFLDESVRNRLEIHQQNKHNAFDDSIITIELYNNFMLMMRNYYKYVTMFEQVGEALRETNDENLELKSINEGLEQRIFEKDLIEEQLKAKIEELQSNNKNLNDVLNQTKEYLLTLSENEE